MPLRISLVSQEYPPETAHGGIGSQTYLKAHGLAALGHEVHVISHSTDGAKQEYKDEAVRVTRIPSIDNRLPIHTEPVKWITYSVEVAAAVSDLHSRAPLDLVDFPEWGSEGYVHLLNRTEWNSIPTVLQLHGPIVMLANTIGWPEANSEFYRIGSAMEGTCLRLADAVFSSSKCSADWCATQYGLPREQIKILHMGVDTELFCPQDVPKASLPTIIFVGKIERNKGVELLLDAACELAREFPNLRLRMLGRGNLALTEQLRAKVAASGLPDLLELPGFVPKEELPSHICKAHVFAAPSFYEGGPGLVYLEAMACGLPVIACKGSGAEEVVIPEENGILVPSGDVDVLAKAVRRLLRHREEREAMGARARAHVLAEADTRVLIRRLEAFYSVVANGNKVPATQN